MEELASEVASGIAQKFGIQVAPGESETIATVMTFISTEALKAGLELVLPSVAAGMSFSPTGISLALIQKQLKQLQEKVDMLLDAPILLAKDKLKEAIIRMETQNFKAAYEDFKTIGTKASEAFNQSVEFKDKIFATKLRLFSLLMEASYDKEQEAFLTYPHIQKLRQKEVGMHMKSVVDKLLAVDWKPSLGDKIKFRDKQQSKEIRGKINEILTATYPFISKGLGWTQDKVINMTFDVISIKIDPAYVPVGKNAAAAMLLSLGTSWDDGEVVTIKVYCQSKKKDTLVIESSEFSIDRGTEQITMLHIIITNTGVSVFQKWSALEKKLSELKVGLALDTLRDLRTSAQIKQEDALLDDYRQLSKRIQFECAHSVDRRSISKNEQEKRLQIIYAKDPHTHDNNMLIEMIHSLLENDPKNLLKPVDDENSTILHRLVFNNRGEVVHNLLEDGQFEKVLEEALLKRDDNGKSPIALAPTHLQDDNILIQMIKSFLAIDPKNLLKPVDNGNRTILHQLITNNRWKVLQILSEDSNLVNVLKEALLRMNDYDDNMLIKIIQNFQANDPKNLLKPVDDDNSTILHRLVFKNRGEVIHELIKDGQFENVLEEALLKRDDSGKSPIALALIHLQDNNLLYELIHCLMENDPKNLLKHMDDDKRTILHQLVLHSRREVIRKLFEGRQFEQVLGEALLQRDYAGKCPIALAPMHLEDDNILNQMIKSILAFDPKHLFKPVDNGNRTIIHQLINNSRQKVIQKLSEDSRMVNVLNEALLRMDDYGDDILIEVINIFVANDPKKMLKPVTEKNSTILHILAVKNRGEVIHKLLEDSRFKNVLEEALLRRNDNGGSPLSLASEYLKEDNKVTEMIKQFTSNDPNNMLKPVDDKNSTILHLLTINNRVGVIHKLLNDSRLNNVLQEALLKLKNNGHSPLSTATCYLREDNVLLELINYLTSNDPKNLLKPVTDKNSTILHQLANDNRGEVIHKLLKDSQLTNVLEEALLKSNDNGHSPLSIATSYWKEDKVLFELINSFTSNDPENLLKPMTDKNSTILHQLANNNREEVIHKLLEDSRLTNVLEEALLQRNDNGYSPMSIATSYWKEDNKVIELIDYVTSNDPKNLLKPVTGKNSTILHQLANNNRGEVIHKLLEDSRLTNVLEEALLKRNDNGYSPLSIATGYLKEDNLLFELINHFTSDDPKNLLKPVTEKNSTILHELASNNRGEVIHKLLEDNRLNNVLLEALLQRKNNGHSPLSIATCYLKKDNVLFELINNFTSNDPKNLLKPVTDKNSTILHELVSDNRGEVIHKLLKERGLTNVLEEALLKRNDNGHSPLSTATCYLKEDNNIIELINYVTSNDPNNLLKPVTEKNSTILHQLANNNRGEVIHQLLEDSRLTHVLEKALLTRNDNGHSPMSIVTSYWKEDNKVIELINYVTSNDPKNLLKPVTGNNSTILHQLANNNRWEVIHKLLEDSGLSNVFEDALLKRNDYGDSPLSTATGYLKEDNVLFELIDCLTSNDPKNLLKPVTGKNSTILHLLTNNNRGEVIHKLLKDSRLSNVLEEALLKRNDNGDSPLSTATCYLKEDKVLFELINYFTSNDPKNLSKPVNQLNSTILHRLAHENRGEVIHKLLKDSRLTNVLEEALLKSNKNGHSPLSLSTQFLKDDILLIKMIENTKLEKLSKPAGEGPGKTTTLDLLLLHKRTSVIQKLQWQ